MRSHSSPAARRRRSPRAAARRRPPCPAWPARCGAAARTRLAASPARSASPRRRPPPLHRRHPPPRPAAARRCRRRGRPRRRPRAPRPRHRPDRPRQAPAWHWQLHEAQHAEHKGERRTQPLCAGWLVPPLSFCHLRADAISTPERTQIHCVLIAAQPRGYNSKMVASLSLAVWRLNEF